MLKHELKSIIHQAILAGVFLALNAGIFVSTYIIDRTEFESTDRYILVLSVVICALCIGIPQKRRVRKKAREIERANNKRCREFGRIKSEKRKRMLNVPRTEKQLKKDLKAKRSQRRFK